MSDVKSAFLYGTIEEEVYVCQPLGFEDPEFPNKVYKVEKALYGLHQAPRAWYETLSTYLLENRFRRGTIDKNLFIKKDKGDILLVKQKDDGIFISQDKYVVAIMKKFDFTTVKTSSTPIETNKALLKDEEAADMDVHLYRSMIGSLMYLTASRPDIMFAVCACARFQVTPKTSHLHAVKRIFRYLKGHLKLGLWYSRDSPFDLEAFSDTDYAGASLDRKSTIGGCQFLGRRLISWQCKKQTIVANSTTEAEYVAAANCCGQIHTDHNVADLLTKAFDVSRFQYLIANKNVIKEWEDRMERAATTASSLEAEQDNGNINRTQSMATLNESFPQGTGSDSGLMCQYIILGGAEAQISSEDYQLGWNEFSSTMASAIICLATNQKFNFSKYIFDHMMKNLEGGVKFLMYPRFVQVFLDKQVEGMSKHKGIYVTSSHTKKIFANMKREGKGFSRRITPLFQTMMVQDPEDMEPIPDEATNKEPISIPSCDPPQSGDDRLQLTELMNLCTKLQNQVLDLEEAKTSQAKEIASLKKRVKQLEKRKNLGAQEDASKHGRKIADLDAEEEVKKLLLNKKLLKRKLVMLFQLLLLIKEAKPKAVTTSATTITTAVASTRPKAKGIVFHDQEEQASAFTPIVSSSQLPQAKDKGKGKMVEPEKPLKKKYQIILNEELALTLHAEEQAEIQAMIEADEQLASRLQAEEQEQFSIEEKSRMLVEMIAERKTFFASQGAAEQRRVDKAYKQVNSFVPMDSEVVKSSETRTEGSSKRARDELEYDKLKKQKIDEHVEVEKDDDQEEAEIKRHIEIVKDDEVAIDAIPLATKTPMIVEFEIDKDGRMGYFKLIRADGSSKRYSSMIKML
ncbi:putative ribonuclease H-like domain-containing protein [Tanacetum coccineum]